MKRRRRGKTNRTNRVLTCQPLESRVVLAASLGWDGPGLGSASLTYHIANSPSSLSPADTHAAIEKALAVWSSVANINFTPTSQSGLRDSLDISFSPIDGGGGTLAQAYFPDDVNPARIAGDVQFDSSEVWEVGNGQGSRAFDLVWVAVHEIGHALGLDHINVSGSVLAPAVSPNQSFVKLDAAAVGEIQSLYSSQPGSTNTTGSNTTATNTISTSSSQNTAPTTPTTNSIPWQRWFRFSWFRFAGRVEADVIVAEVAPLHNYAFPTDVNGDGNASAVDVLQIINYLNRSGGLSENVDTADKVDTNGDGNVSAIDALFVVNAINSGTATQAVSSTLSGEANELASVDLAATDSESVDEADEGDSANYDSSDDEGIPADNDGECAIHPAQSTLANIFPLVGLVQNSSQRLLARFDANSDGQLVKAEVPVRVWQKLVDLSVDADGDGVLTTLELEVQATVAREKYFADRDTDSDGLLTEVEVGALAWSRLSSADRDATAGVSIDELATWIVARQAELPDLGRHRQHVDLLDKVFRQVAIGIRRFH